MHELTCDEVHDAAPQFALDILDPSARADVAAHLLRCPCCREEVTEMEASAAHLLDLDEQFLCDDHIVEPPSLEYADCLDYPECLDYPDYLDDPDDLDYLGYPEFVDSAEVGPRKRRRRLRVVATLAAVAALVVGTAVSPGLTDPSSRVVPLASAQLLQADRVVGKVNFYRRHVPSVALTVQGVAATGWLTCELIGLNGTVSYLGSFELHSGSGYWGSSTSVDPAGLAGFDLVDHTGRVVVAAANA